MTKPDLISAALVTAALLTTPAMAQQDQLTSQRLIANGRVTTTVHSADRQACCRNRAKDLPGIADHDVWGHWGTYYGPMVHVP
jgi:hypothetical protein